MTDDVQQRIHETVTTNKIVLFMKGSPDFPMCGFSGLAAQILNQIGVPYKAVNVLEDEAIRQGIKIYGNWPTIPQLYVAGELVGGSDIMKEMFESGELQKLIQDALAQ